MKYHTEDDKKIKNHMCDVCEIDLAKIKSGSLRCEICDYDVCDQCLQKQ
jgi:hypothetical protein